MHSVIQEPFYPGLFYCGCILPSFVLHTDVLDVWTFWMFRMLRIPQTVMCMTEAGPPSPDWVFCVGVLHTNVLGVWTQADANRAASKQA